MKGFLRFLIGLFAPFILIFGGAAVVGLGMKYSSDVLLWTGLAAMGAGVLWGLILYFMNDSVSLFD